MLLEDWIWRRGEKVKKPTCFLGLHRQFLGNAYSNWGLKQRDNWGRELEEGILWSTYDEGKEKGRPQKMGCNRAEDETGGWLDLEKRREQWRSAVRLPASLTFVIGRMTGNQFPLWIYCFSFPFFLCICGKAIHFVFWWDSCVVKNGILHLYPFIVPFWGSFPSVCFFLFWFVGFYFLIYIILYQLYYIILYFLRPFFFIF